MNLFIILALLFFSWLLSSVLVTNTLCSEPKKMDMVDTQISTDTK